MAFWKFESVSGKLMKNTDEQKRENKREREREIEMENDANDRMQRTHSNRWEGKGRTRVPSQRQRSVNCGSLSGHVCMCPFPSRLFVLVRLISIHFPKLSHSLSLSLSRFLSSVLRVLRVLESVFQKFSQISRKSSSPNHSNGQES